MGDAVIWECAIRDKKGLPDHIQTLACCLRSECEYLESRVYSLMMTFILGQMPVENEKFHEPSLSSRFAADAFNILLHNF